MKSIIKSQKKISTITLIIATFTLLFVPAQTVLADPGIGATTIPSTGTVGGTVNAGGDGVPGEEYTDVRIRVYDPMPIAQVDVSVLTSNPTPSTPGTCGFLPHPTAGRYWDYWAVGSVAPARLNMFVADQLALVRFGDSATTLVAEPGVFGTGVSNDPAQTGPFVWRSDTGVDNSDVIDIFTPVASGDAWAVAVCSNRMAADGSDTTSGAFVVITRQVSSFNTQQPVAGEIIPIDTTALLIAGVTTNPMWTLSALAVIAGVAVTVFRFQVYRK